MLTYFKIYKFSGNYFGLDTIDDKNILKSGIEYLKTFLNSSNCCTLYIQVTDTNTLEAIEKIVSEIKTNVIA